MTDTYKCGDCKRDMPYFDPSKPERDNIHACRSYRWDGEDYSFCDVTRENRGGPRQGCCTEDRDSNGNPIKKPSQ